MSERLAGRQRDPAEALGLHRDVVSDYEGLDTARWTRPWSHRTVLVLTVAGALLAGFLLSAALRAGRTVALEQDVRRTELIGLIEERRAHTQRLSAQLEALRRDVDAAEAEAAAGVPALRARLAELEVAAGLTALRGPGLRVELADASGTCATGRTEDCQIQDTDLQLAVNALFAVGAEAVAVNGERVIATTAIRSAGRSVLVNYEVLASPYVIEAIGDPEGLRRRFAESAVASDFTVWKDVYGLGFSIQQADELTLPPYDGGLRLRVAAPAGEALP
ncbi:MAG TPA: DUF881 domain-containing protein [Egibacteraceae bacterium]|nr:DUF881 domain-containing protein [Egibacteraceae bacterium]